MTASIVKVTKTPCPECGAELDHVPLGPGVFTDVCFKCGYENKTDNRIRR